MLFLSKKRKTINFYLEKYKITKIFLALPSKVDTRWKHCVVIRNERPDQSPESKNPWKVSAIREASD